jgi:Phage integrase family
LPERAEIGGRRKIHDFRRSAARNYVKAGVHSHTVMKVIGWKQDAMLRRYNTQTESDLRDAAAQVGAAKVSGTEPRDKGTVTPISKN